MKEDFKLFVRNKPELIDYVTNGSMTWQKFYELYSLYGSDSNIWNKYKKIESVKEENNFNFSSLMNTIKNVDMDSVKKGINSFSKVVELLQGLVTKDASKASSSYEPRKLFQKFED